MNDSISNPNDMDDSVALACPVGAQNGGTPYDIVNRAGPFGAPAVGHRWGC